MTALTHSSGTTSSNDVYYPSSDEAELARVQSLAGFGEVALDDGEAEEFKGLFTELGDFEAQSKRL